MAVALMVCGYAEAQVPAAAPSRKPTWEVLVVSDPVTGPDAPAVPDLRASVRDGGIVLISCDRPVCVKVYSILGQLITQKQMQAGTVRLNMDARGIYILKADNATRRISL